MLLTRNNGRREENIHKKDFQLVSLMLLLFIRRKFMATGDLRLEKGCKRDTRHLFYPK
jgi:hypothetical protein